MNEQEMRAVFLLAKLDVLGFQRLENKYWPIPEDEDPQADYYRQLSQNSPWWRVTTEYGDIILGKRKRVYSIDWSGIGRIRPMRVSQDDVTQYDFTIHAWSLAKVVEYLNSLRQELK